MDADLLVSMVKAVELKDRSTAAHTWRVGLYMMALMEDLGASRVETDRYVAAAVLHDVGKIEIPQAILGKPGPLTDEERAVMQTHTTLGHERLLRMGESDPVILALVRSHHERIDGTGYPDRLEGEEIPAPARCFAVIDTFDAMTSLRPYRPSADPAAAVERAVDELERYAGIWYCEKAVERFIGLVRDGRLDWVLRHFNDADALWTLDHLPDCSALRNVKMRQGQPSG